MSLLRASGKWTGRDAAFVFLAFFLTGGWVLTSHAQGLAGKGYRFNLSVNHDTGDYLNGLPDADDAWEMGYSFTAFADYNFSDHFAAQPELSYTKRAWDHKYEVYPLWGADPWRVMEYEEHIIHATALFKYRVWTRGATPSILGGLQVGETVHVTVNDHDEYTPKSTPQDPVPADRMYIRDFARTHLALVAGVAMEIPMGYGRVYTDVRYTYDLWNTWQEDLADAAGADLRIMSLSVSLGYLF